MGRIGRATLAAAAGWLGWSALAVPHQVPLPPALPGQRRDLHGRAGRLNCYVAGQATDGAAPLLLVHSVNACASAREVKPIHDRAIGVRRVWAPDLPGFGFSDRSKRRYDVRLYVDAIHDVLDAIEAEHGPQPVDVLGVSLACEFVARAATERPERFRTLSLVTPTGFAKGAEKRQRGEAGEVLGLPALQPVFGFPVWDRALYDALTSKPSIRFFLTQTFGTPKLDPDLVEYDWLTAHQPGAQHAVWAFATASLFSADIRHVYERLRMPVWMPHATRGQFSDFTEAGFVREKPNWTIRPFATGALPQFEKPDTFWQALQQFLQEAEGVLSARTVAAA